MQIIPLTKYAPSLDIPTVKVTFPPPPPQKKLFPLSFPPMQKKFPLIPEKKWETILAF